MTPIAPPADRLAPRADRRVCFPTDIHRCDCDDLQRGPEPRPNPKYYSGRCSGSGRSEALGGPESDDLPETATIPPAI